MARRRLGTRSRYHKKANAIQMNLLQLQRSGARLRPTREPSKVPDEYMGVDTSAKMSHANAGRQSQSSAPKSSFLVCLILKRKATAIAPSIGKSIPQAVTLVGLTYVILRRC